MHFNNYLIIMILVADFGIGASGKQKLKLLMAEDYQQSILWSFASAEEKATSGQATEAGH